MHMVCRVSAHLSALPNKETVKYFFSLIVEIIIILFKKLDLYYYFQ